ncbi:MAG: DUF4157 domain-containing protein [Planctomycetes bacterium]|nr:DUF4157 domain-containing protein [Planctomycetota bacterium]
MRPDQRSDDSRSGHEFGQIRVDPRAGFDPGAASGGQRLDPRTRAYFGSRFGTDFDDVRVHTDERAVESARQLKASAYAHGGHLVFDRGRYAPHSPAGRQLLAHELAHVVQARRGRGPAASSQHVAEPGAAVEREAAQVSRRIRCGLPAGPVKGSLGGIALTANSKAIERLISYSAGDWAVTDEEEAAVLRLLRSDPDISATVNDLEAAGMLEAMIDRVSEFRRELLLVLGDRLTKGSDWALVIPYVRDLGPEWELQFNMGWHGLTKSARRFDPKKLSHVVGKGPTDPFGGSGATGVNPTKRSIGLRDQYNLWQKDPATEARYSNPISGPLMPYVTGLSAADRRDQAKLLLRRKISTVEKDSYGGKLPSRAQVVRAAAKEHDLAPEHLAGFLLAEQRDQSRNEDAKDYIGATTVNANLSIGLGQVVVSTARKHDLFADLMSKKTRRSLDHDGIARLLASDEYNIFAVARYIRIVADAGAKKSLKSLPMTKAQYPGLDLKAYAGHSKGWPDDNLKALASEYTSKMWDDGLVPAWGEFVFAAIKDVKASKVF